MSLQGALKSLYIWPLDDLAKVHLVKDFVVIEFRAPRILMEDCNNASFLRARGREEGACKGHVEKYKQVLFFNAFLVRQIVVVVCGNQELPLAVHDSGVAHFVSQRECRILNQVNDMCCLVDEFASIYSITVILEPVLSSLNVDQSFLIRFHCPVRIFKIDLLESLCSQIIALLGRMNFSHLPLNMGVFLFEGNHVPLCCDLVDDEETQVKS